MAAPCGASVTSAHDAKMLVRELELARRRGRSRPWWCSDFSHQI